MAHLKKMLFKYQKQVRHILNYSNVGVKVNSSDS